MSNQTDKGEKALNILTEYVRNTPDGYKVVARYFLASLPWSKLILAVKDLELK